MASKFRGKYLQIIPLGKYLLKFPAITAVDAVTFMYMHVCCVMPQYYCRILVLHWAKARQRITVVARARVWLGQWLA